LDSYANGIDRPPSETTCVRAVLRRSPEISTQTIYGMGIWYVDANSDPQLDVGAAHGPSSQLGAGDDDDIAIT